MPLTDSTRLPADGDQARLDRLGFRLIAIGAVVRLLFAALYPMNLAGDEAYYWEWSRRPDWGYFSKPPGIAWLMGLVTGLGGAHTVTIRIASAVLGVGSLLLLRALTKALFGSRAAVVAILLALATPANVLLNFMLTIDAPLIFCWSAALWFFWSWISDETHRSRWLIGFSLALAGGYLSKQMMLVFPLLALIFLATARDLRPLLKSPSLWLALAASLIALVPPLWWNSQNDWITFHHTGGQIAGDTDNRVFGVTFLEFLATQAGVLSPVTWFFVLVTAYAGLRRFGQIGNGGRFLVIFSSPAIVVMILMSLRQTMLPNWAAVYYIAAIILVSGWLAGKLPSLALPPAWQRAFKPGLALGFLMVATGYLLPPILEATNHAGDENLDPMRRLRGHQQFAEAVAPILETAPPHPEKTFVVALGHRYFASHLAFYLPGQPKVYRWERHDHVASQYELWPNPVEDDLTGWDAIVIMPSESSKVTRRFEGAFEEFELIEEVEVVVSPHYRRYFRAYLGRNLTNWPAGFPLEKQDSSPEEILPADDPPES